MVWEIQWFGIFLIKQEELERLKFLSTLSNLVTGEN